MKIDVYKVDSGIPVPAKGVPLNQLEVGESFVVPIDKRRSVATVASRVKRETGKKFTIRKIDNDNVRVWRTE
jgi:hypothetical protein